jgi:hypothetical protein
VLDIHRLEIGGAQLEDFRSQQELAPLARDVACSSSVRRQRRAVAAGMRAMLAISLKVSAE